MTPAARSRHRARFRRRAAGFTGRLPSALVQIERDEMSMERRVLEAIRDAADPFAARPEDCLKRLRVDQRGFVRMVGQLQKGGLVDVDDESGALSLTDAGTVALSEEEDTDVAKNTVTEQVVEVKDAIVKTATAAVAKSAEVIMDTVDAAKKVVKSRRTARKAAIKPAVNKAAHVTSKKIAAKKAVAKPKAKAATRKSAKRAAARKARGS